MLVFNNLDEMKRYFNERNNTYEFINENGERENIKINFDLITKANIKAGDITAQDIDAWNITARDIDAGNITARDIDAGNITARDINAQDIDAWNITAQDIKSWNIDALNISYYAVCFAYDIFKCESVQGRRENAKHFCLDNEIEYIN